MTTPRMTHLPSRLTWNCRVCSDPWLCGKGVTELRAVYDNALQAPELRQFLNHMFGLAIKDYQAHGAPTLANLADRMYGWLAADVLAATPPSFAPVNNPHWQLVTGRALNSRQP